MNIGIMQPYFFPYIGYFQLINAVDKFIFYDDVNYIKQGWINRNRILMNGRDSLFTVKLKDASSYRPINEIEINSGNEKLTKTIIQAYSKAPYFKDVFPLIQNIFDSMHEIKKISQIAQLSVKKVFEYLDINKTFEASSQIYGHTKDFGKAERIITICRENGADTYINSYGGQELYSKSEFCEKGIALHFIKNNLPVYKQFKDGFVPGLSIIDVLMFNSKDEIKEMLNHYELI
jgi:hypothetical protein